MLEEHGRLDTVAHFIQHAKADIPDAPDSSYVEKLLSHIEKILQGEVEPTAISMDI